MSSRLAQQPMAPPNDADLNGTPSPSSGFPISRPIGYKEVKEVEKIEDDVLRNLLITLSYYDLSVQMDCLLGHENLNWCTFGTWASKTAGNTIRKEFPPFPQWFTNLAAVVPFFRGRIQNSSDQVAEGNHKVFMELAPFFADMVETFQHDDQPDWDKFNAFIERIREVKRRDREMPNKLIRAFNQYYLAMFENDIDKKAELIFYGNCLIAYHEQARLQPEIAGAVKLGFRTEFFRRLWHWFATRYLLQIELGDRKLILGRSVKVRFGRRSFQPELEDLENPHLKIFLKTFDRYLDNIDKSAATNWSLIVDRMLFITKFFRSHQRDRRLLDCPFAPFQQKDMAEGRVPIGDL